MFRLKWNRTFFKETSPSPSQLILVATAIFADANGVVCLDDDDLAHAAALAKCGSIEVMEQLRIAAGDGWITKPSAIDGEVRFSLRIPD